MFISSPCVHVCPQAHPRELSRVTGSLLHFRALNNALNCARSDISYVRHALETVDIEDWQKIEDTVAANLSSATLRLAGALDGMIILANKLADPKFVPQSDMSFTRTQFIDIHLRSIQERMKVCRSVFDPLVSVQYADFWTVSDFWKHYFPYQPRPSHFTRDNLRDFQVELGNCASGPIMHDVIYPIFNGAADLLHHIATTNFPDCELNVVAALC